MTSQLRRSMLFLLFMNSCGNPVSLQKDLTSEEEKRKSAEQASVELTSEVASLKRFLTHIYVSTNHLWVFTGMASSYDAANSQCDNIAYTLPSEAAIEEFKSEILPKHPEWSKYIAQLQIDAKPVRVDSGVVLCRIDRK